jgi:uncharacterized protein
MQDHYLPVLFGSRLRAKLLGWLFIHPGELFFVRQLTSLIQEDSTNVSRETARLEKMGILVSTRIGRQKHYQVNKKCCIFRELQGLATKTFGLTEALQKMLIPVKDKVVIAFVYGGLANNIATLASEIDLLVIGDAAFRDVETNLKRAKQCIGRDINLTFYPLNEFRSRIEKERYFVQNVLTGAKLFIIGDENELDRLVKGRLIR